MLVTVSVRLHIPRRIKVRYVLVIPWMEMDRNRLCVRVLCALIIVMILLHLLLGAAGYTC